jgi:hypothetical protein
LSLKCDVLVSKCPFQRVNLYRYSVAAAKELAMKAASAGLYSC